LAETNRSAMAFVDGWRYDADYFLTDVGNVDEILARWFSQMNVRVRRVKDFGALPDMPEPLRISAVVDPAEGRELESHLRERFDGQLNLHMIFAPNYDVTIVEAFAAGVDKLSGVRYVAQSWRIPMSQVIAVGDDVNDVPLLTGAGLGVAMPDAPDEVKQTSARVATDGLAALIHTLIDEETP
jgi:hydroxymethylpyrimidine pyrophosphatase-like HAD family hydrolase